MPEVAVCELSDLEPVEAVALESFAEFLTTPDGSRLADLVQFSAEDGEPIIPRSLAGIFRQWLADRAVASGETA